MSLAEKTYQESYGGDFRELFRNPGALVAGAIGTLLTSAMLILLAFLLSEDCVANFTAAWERQGRELYSQDYKDAVNAECENLDDVVCADKLRAQWISDERSPHSIEFNLAITDACPAETKEEDEFEIDFEPGALVKLGAEIEEKELPEKIIIQETRAEEEVVAETVTEDEEAKPVEEPPPEPDKKPKKTDKPPPKEKKDKKLPTSKLPTTSNTPYKDLPTVKVPKGDPFGDPGGWADLAKDGDPWATAVMKALNNMPVGSFGAKIGRGTMKFQLTLCKDGKIKNVNKKGGSLAGPDQSKVITALNQLKLPKPPAKVAKKMKKSCAKIKYTFVWSSGKVK